MNKEEFTYLVGSKLNAEKNELSIANDIFLQKVIDKLEPGETLRVPGIGIFQLNQKKTTPGQFIQSEQKEFQLFFVPQNYNRNEPQDILYLPAKYDKKNSETIDNIFSISYGKSLIPVGANSKKDLLIQSTYLMLQKAFEDKSEKMLENAVYLKDFKIDYRTEANLSLESVMKPDKIDETGPEEENIPWNFGLPLTQMNGSEIEETDKSEPPEWNIEKPEREQEYWNLNQRELSGLEDPEPDKNDFPIKEDSEDEDFQEKDSLNLIPDDFTNEENTAEDEGEINSNNSFPSFEQTPEKEDSFADHLESEMEKFYDENERDSSGVNEQANLNFESDSFPPVIDEDEQIQYKPDNYKNIPVDQISEPVEQKRGLGAWFWSVIVIFVLVSAAGYYYYFYYAKGNSSDFLKPVHKKVTPQIIEREYSIPVAVIPQDSEKVAARSKEIENKNNSVPDKTEKTNIPGDEKESDSGGSLYRSDRKNSSLNDNIYTDGQRFTIQVSSWRTKSVAEKETLELKSSGYDAYISQYKSGRAPLYRVRVGDYASQAEAERVLKELR